MNFYRVNGPQLWGGYGRILAAGMARRGDSADDPFLLFRTGPFIPPISFPYRHVVVTEEFRTQIDASGFLSFEYKPIVKQHIVKLRWELWDRDADDPKKYPRHGEPEGYILDHWHSRSAAKRMGTIWELVLEKGAETSSYQPEGERRRRVMVNPKTWDGQDFFQSTNQGWYIVTQRGGEWLQHHGGEWVTLDVCPDWDPNTIES